MGHTLFDPDEVIKKCGGAPRSMKGVGQLPAKLKVPDPIDAPTKLPSVGDDLVKKAQKHLCGKSGEVPSLQDLKLELKGDGSPFKVLHP